MNKRRHAQAGAEHAAGKKSRKPFEPPRNR
jgi:hypothetical protein